MKVLDSLIQTKRVFILPTIAMLIIGLLFMPANIPTVKMNAKHLPLGLVIEDTGAMGKSLGQALLTNTPEAIVFKLYTSLDDMMLAMDNKELYGGLMFPQHFSSQINTLQLKVPEKATVYVYINEGANATAATVAQTAMTTIVSTLNSQVSSQVLLTSPIAPSLVQTYANPIVAEVVKVNEVGDLVSAPSGLLTVTWFSSLSGAVILYFIAIKRTCSTAINRLKFHLFQSVLPLIYGATAGYMLTWYSTWILGYQFASFHSVALYVALAVTAFMYMIFATLRWLKLPSIALYVLLMFFSMAAVQLPPEMVTPFFRDYILSWLPLRIFVEGFKELLFFSGELFNSYSTVFVLIIAVSFILVWIKNGVEKAKS